MSDYAHWQYTFNAPTFRHTSMFNLAIIGDVHLHFNQQDVTFFNQSAYDLILCVGDLSNWRPHEGLKTAHFLAQLQKPTLFMPGNHDTLTGQQLLAEINHWSPVIQLTSHGQEQRVDALRQALGPVIWGGYGVHPFTRGDEAITVITARPHAMGGSDFSCAPYLGRQYGLYSLAQSGEKLMACVDAAATTQLIFLAHNGPTGLGDKATDIWGCDFLAEEGDFGDEDLRQAIVYARQKGKQVIAVIAGHMHHAIKHRPNRTWHRIVDGIHYLNAARVPRIFYDNGHTLHHHLALTLQTGIVQVEEKLECVSSQYFGKNVA
ncbi:MAG: metallophosphoesterase [Candidatus Promineifilaceae bacterium]